MDEETVPWLSSEPDAPVRPLNGSLTTRFAIVGGGLAGLSAAYHLSKLCSPESIVILEARRIGAGASGRNTGMLGPGVGGTITALCKRYGSDVAARMFNATLEAVDLVIQTIREEKLACELEVTGQLIVARTARQARSLEEQSFVLRELGFDATYLDAAALAKRVDFGSYRGAITYPRAAMFHPRLLCREFERVLRARGVRIYESSPVRAVQPGRPVTLGLGNATVFAEKVVITTNGYSGSLGVLRSRIIPLHSHVVMTEPLSAEQLQTLGWHGREAMIESRNYFNYYRLSRDNRIVFGGGPALYRHAPGNPRAGATDLCEASLWRRLERELDATFPTLSPPRIAGRWAGTMGFTLDRLPVVGQLNSELPIYFAGGCCGHGLALSSAAGKYIAEAIATGSSPRAALPWHRSSAPALPPDPYREIALRAYLKALDVIDWLGARADAHR